MNRLVFITRTLLVAGLGITLATPALAQATAGPAASTAASAPEAKPARRPLSNEALRDSGTFPEDLQPEAPKPQIKVPLGRKPPAPTDSVSRTDGPRPKIDDSLARCKARAEPASRQACERALAASAAP